MLFFLIPLLFNLYIKAILSFYVFQYQILKKVLHIFSFNKINLLIMGDIKMINEL